MRPHLLNYKYRKKIYYVIFISHNISCCVSSYSKFTDRESVVVIQYVFFKQCFALHPILKVITAIIRHKTILEIYRKVIKLNIIKVNTAYIKYTICSFKNCKTVFKNSFLIRIINLHNRYSDIGLVVVFSMNFNIFCCIKDIYDILLYSLIFFIIKSIYLNYFIEYFRELISYLW